MYIKNVRQNSILKTNFLNIYASNINKQNLTRYSIRITR